MQAELVPVVEVINSRPVVSSLKIAEQFQKNHKHVLRDIRKIIKDVSVDFAGSNFGPCDYLGENGKQAPMFWLTKDGFMILVMGYTGKEFMRIKEAYICRFNEMEAQILGRTEHPAPTTLTPSTAEDRKPLNALISAWIASSPLSYRGAWAQIHAHFNITKAADLPKEWLPDVIAFVQERMDSAIAAKPVHPLPSSTPAIDEYKRHVDNVLVALTLFRSNVVMDAQLEAGAKRLSRRDLWPIQQALFDAIGANAAAIESSKRLMDVAQQVLMQQM